MYIYDAEFSMPACYGKPLIRGSTLEDDYAAVYLNDHLIGKGWSANTPTPFSSGNGAYFVPNSTNVLDFLVEDSSVPQTALDFSATITYSTASCGTLKICKVAGYGVTVGTPVTFNYRTNSGSGTVTVPAGPAPGGYCVVVGTVRHGPYTIAEVIPTGDSVTSITPVPTGGTANLGAGTFKGTLTAGIVTEVTYTDAKTTGYLEICKQLSTSSSGVPPFQIFHFVVDGQSVTVPAGACYPALQVPAGSETVTETPVAPYVMTGCSTIPVGNLVSCDPTHNTATMTVAAGSVPDETILTITNGLAGGRTGG